MPTPARLGPRLLTSAAVSVLAASAAVLAHLVAAGHAPGPGLVVVVALVLGLADATVATVLRGTWGTAVRAVALQVVAHGVLTTAAAVTGAAHGGGGHHAVALATPTASVALLPSAPMLAAHLVVGAVVALLLGRTAEGTRAALTAGHLVRAVDEVVDVLLGVARFVPAGAPRVLPRAHVPVLVRPSVWTGTSPVRRGPPATAA